MDKTRKKIPDEIRADLKYKNQLMCCVCEGNKKGVHIHHLDGNPANNNIKNLVLLCFDHHNEATISNSLATTLSKSDIIKYKLEWETEVEIERRARRDSIITQSNHSVEKLNDNISAIIILEFDKAFAEINKRRAKNKVDRFDELNIYSKHTNSSIYLYLLEHLLECSTSTRSGMNYDEGNCIDFLVDSFFPYEEKDEHVISEFVRQITGIGENIAYDAVIHLKKLNVAYTGFMILRYANYIAFKYNLDESKELVLNAFKELEQNFIRPERTDLKLAQALHSVFANELKTGEYGYADLGYELRTKVFANE